MMACAEWYVDVWRHMVVWSDVIWSDMVIHGCCDGVSWDMMVYGVKLWYVEYCGYVWCDVMIFL